MAEGGVTGAGCIPLPVPENVRPASENYHSHIQTRETTFFVLSRIDRERFCYCIGDCHPDSTVKKILLPLKIFTIVFYFSYRLGHMYIRFDFSPIDN